jgi:hypothetical protein
MNLQRTRNANASAARTNRCAGARWLDRDVLLVADNPNLSFGAGRLNHAVPRIRYSRPDAANAPPQQGKSIKLMGAFGKTPQIEVSAAKRAAIVAPRRRKGFTFFVVPPLVPIGILRVGLEKAIGGKSRILISAESPRSRVVFHGDRGGCFVDATADAGGG